jgi:hypothetical protein
MKNPFIKLISVAFLLGSLFKPTPPPVYAQLAGVENPLEGKFSTVGDIISKLIPFVFTFAAMLALLLLIWGGFKYMLAQGDPKQLDSARNSISGAVIGLLIIVFIVAIIQIIGAVFKIKIIF